jgi:hypothetical protein
VNALWTKVTPMRNRTDRLRQPKFMLACSTLPTSDGTAASLVACGVNPVSCMVAKPATNTAPSSAARTTNGPARSTLPSSPPPIEPTSMAAPDTIDPRAKT